MFNIENIENIENLRSYVGKDIIMYHSVKAAARDQGFPSFDC